MKNSKLFQYIVIGLFIFFIIVGAILFSTYKNNSAGDIQISITMWGTLPQTSFSSFSNPYFTDAKLKYTVNYIEKNPATFDQDLVEALASGSGPDAVILPQDLIVRYANKIYPIPYAVLSETIFKQTYVQEGELFLNSAGIMGLPFSIDPLVMYWNRDIFNNAGVTKPPVSWSDIAGLLPKMTKKDQAGNILASTVALGEFRNINNAKEILSALIIQLGNPLVIMNPDNTFTGVLNGNSNTNNSSASLALQFYTNFSNPSKATYSWNRSLPSALDSFANGDLAIYFGFASEYLTIKNKNPNLNFAVDALPQIINAKVLNTFGNMLGFAIMKNSQNPGGAYTILSSLTSAAAYPFSADVFNVSSARRDILGQAEPNAIKSIFNKSAIISKGWLDPNKAETSAIFQDMIESYTTGKNNIDTAVNTASARLNGLLNQ